MRNSVYSILLVGILTISCFNFVTAESNENTQYDDLNSCLSYSVENMACTFAHGPLIGGLSLAVNNSDSSNISTADGTNGFPVIAEDYTATWCENCVEVEEALDQVANDMSMTQLHFHKCCLGEGEYEDPFGTIAGDEWWDRRNGQRLQPMVVINGGTPVIGSISGTYENFKSLAETKVVDENPNLSFTWENYGNSTGKVTWSFDNVEWGKQINSSSLIPENYNPSLFLSLFVVEDTVYFPDGSNGLTNYHYVVKDVIGLGNASGEKVVTMPEIYDGDDLSLVLVMEINGWGINEDIEINIDPVEDSSMLPNISVSMTIVCLLGAAFSRTCIKKFE